MLESLAKHQNELHAMARKIAGKDADDILQETYIKLHDSGKDYNDINFGYIYQTMNSIYIDSIKSSSAKNRFVLFDSYFWERLEEKLEEYDTEHREVSIDKSKLTTFENMLLFSLYGMDMTNEKNEIIQRIKGTSMLSLSKETNIPYRTIYTTVQRIKKKLK